MYTNIDQNNTLQKKTDLKIKNKTIMVRAVWALVLRVRYFKISASWFLNLRFLR